jgi:hypothetical protein
MRLPEIHPLSRRDVSAVLLYLPLAGLAAAALMSHGRPWAALGLVPAVLGPWGIVVSSTVLRLGYIGTGFSDQVAVSEAARTRALSGESPYGVGYAESFPPGSPFPYGPLALLDSVPLELVASIALLILLAFARRPITLALYAGFPFSIVLASAGNNDYVPALLLAAGLLALPSRWGGVMIGLSAVWKPYTSVFLPVAFQHGGIGPFLVGLLTAATGWLPTVWWGGLYESIAMLNALQGSSPWRFLAVPLGLLGFRFGLGAACAAFAALTLTSTIWSLAYLVPLGVALGIAIEPEAPAAKVVPRAGKGTTHI